MLPTQKAKKTLYGKVSKQIINIRISDASVLFTVFFSNRTMLQCNFWPTVDSVMPPTDTHRPSRVWYWYWRSPSSLVIYWKAWDGADQFRLVIVSLEDKQDESQINNCYKLSWLYLCVLIAEGDSHRKNVQQLLPVGDVRYCRLCAVKETQEDVSCVSSVVVNFLSCLLSHAAHHALHPAHTKEDLVSKCKGGNYIGCQKEINLQTEVIWEEANSLWLKNILWTHSERPAVLTWLLLLKTSTSVQSTLKVTVPFLLPSLTRNPIFSYGYF